MFATYCRKYYLIAGQEFLEKIIAFLENNKKVNYNLLKATMHIAFVALTIKQNRILWKRWVI